MLLKQKYLPYSSISYQYDDVSAKKLKKLGYKGRLKVDGRFCTQKCIKKINKEMVFLNPFFQQQIFGSQIYFQARGGKSNSLLNPKSLNINLLAIKSKTELKQLKASIQKCKKIEYLNLKLSIKDEKIQILASILKGIKYLKGLNLNFDVERVHDRSLLFKPNYQLFTKICKIKHLTIQFRGSQKAQQGSISELLLLDLIINSQLETLDLSINEQNYDIPLAPKSTRIPISANQKVLSMLDISKLQSYNITIGISTKTMLNSAKLIYSNTEELSIVLSKEIKKVFYEKIFKESTKVLELILQDDFDETDNSQLDEFTKLRALNLVGSTRLQYNSYFLNRILQSKSFHTVEHLCIDCIYVDTLKNIKIQFPIKQLHLKYYNETLHNDSFPQLMQVESLKKLQVEFLTIGAQYFKNLSFLKNLEDVICTSLHAIDNPLINLPDQWKNIQKLSGQMAIESKTTKSNFKIFSRKFSNMIPNYFNFVSIKDLTMEIRLKQIQDLDMFLEKIHKFTNLEVLNIVIDMYSSHQEQNFNYNWTDKIPQTLREISISIVSNQNDLGGLKFASREYGISLFEKNPNLNKFLVCLKSDLEVGIFASMKRGSS